MFFLAILFAQVYKQKVKHLLYEHQNNITEMKAEGTVSMKLAQKDHRSQEMDLRKDMRTLKVELKEQELANEMVVKNLRLVSLETMLRWSLATFTGGYAKHQPFLQTRGA